MSTRLPLELLHGIFLEAAELFVVSDRAAVTSLALTAHFVHVIVRPVAFRRIIVTNQSHDLVKTLLVSGAICHLVRDLTLCCRTWFGGMAITTHLTNLNSLRGYSHAIEAAIRSLPLASRARLHTLQFWDTAAGSKIRAVVPASVTHASLYLNCRSFIRAKYLAEWTRDVPSITHLGVEVVVVVVEPDQALPTDPEAFALGLEKTLATVGKHVEQLSVRICGNISEDLQAQYVAALQRHARDDSRDLEIDKRLRIWWDHRVLNCYNEEFAASESDARAGRDVWSEAHRLAELDTAP